MAGETIDTFHAEILHWEEIVGGMADGHRLKAKQSGKFRRTPGKLTSNQSEE
jgi:hypothetical protein